MNITALAREKLPFVPTRDRDDAGILESAEESLAVTALAVTAGVITRRGLRMLWRQWRGEPAPVNPIAPEVTWADALIWAAAVGAAAGVSRVLARRGGTAAVQRYRS